jgi:hypothetical protein
MITENDPSIVTIPAGGTGGTDFGFISFGYVARNGD